MTRALDGLVLMDVVPCRFRGVVDLKGESVVALGRRRRDGICGADVVMEGRCGVRPSGSDDARTLLCFTSGTSM